MARPAIVAGEDCTAGLSGQVRTLILVTWPLPADKGVSIP